MNYRVPTLLYAKREDEEANVQIRCQSIDYSTEERSVQLNCIFGPECYALMLGERPLLFGVDNDGSKMLFRGRVTQIESPRATEYEPVMVSYTLVILGKVLALESAPNERTDGMIEHLGYEQIKALRVMRDTPNKGGAEICAEADCSWDELFALSDRGLIAIGEERLKPKELHPTITEAGLSALAEAEFRSL